MRHKSEGLHRLLILLSGLMLVVPCLGLPFFEGVFGTPGPSDVDLTITAVYATNTRVALDMVQVMIDIGELEQARTLFNKLPEKDKSGDTGRSLTSQLTFKQLAAKTTGKDELLRRIASKPDDYDAHFDLSICLVAEHDYRQAMDHLFAILRQEPDYKQGAAREMIISLINMLVSNEPELAQEFRRRLGNELA